jgi:hypothetical protein
MPDGTTTVLGLTLPEEFASDDTWGGKLNTNFSSIDAVFQLNGSDKVLKVANGGTGAASVSAARTSLGAAASGLIASSGLTISTARLAGRTTAATGALEELSAGSGLILTAGTLDRAALIGDVTASLGSNTTTIAATAVTYGKIQNVSATSRILGRKTAGAGSVEELTLSELLDFIGSATQGDILYRGASTWARLGAGTDGQYLKTRGAGVNPEWATVVTGGVTHLGDITCSGSSSSLGSLTLTDYKFLKLVFEDVVPNSGSSYLLLGNSTSDDIQASPAVALYKGFVELDLTTGSGVSILGATNGAAGAVAPFDSPITTASTTVSIAPNGTTWSSGTVRVYGIK